jgi:hypothetical protein
MKYFSLFIFTFLLIFSSCNGFLDKVSPTDVAEDELFKTAAGLRNARIGMYSDLSKKEYYGGYFPLLISAYSDDGSTGGYNNPTLDEIGELSLSSSNKLVYSLWTTMYNVLYTTNAILENVDNIQDVNLSAEERNDIKGEALTVRALVHFDLLRTFGEHWRLSSPYGIPLAQKRLTQNDILKRNTVNECYASIMSDLATAIPLLSDKDTQTDIWKGRAFIGRMTATALYARVTLYSQSYSYSAQFATEVIENTTGYYALFAGSSLKNLYLQRETQESIFELRFNSQNRSQYNAFTYSRPDALRTELTFLADADLHTFFLKRTEDVRISFVDYANVDVSIQPDGRTDKYRGEQLRDNSAYIIRLAEMYLIRAEARRFPAGIGDLNTIRVARGLGAVNPQNEADFYRFLLEERRAEFNFEGHRYFDLARLGKIEEVLGSNVKPVFPIPANELSSSKNEIVQYPGY